MEKKIYFAYGSKLNHNQMAYRCPDAEFVGTGFIKDHTLTFKGDNVGVADIIPCNGVSVPIGVWKISAADERRLDLYEGYPRLYGKRAVRAVCGGELVDGFMQWLLKSPLNCRQKRISTLFLMDIPTAVLTARLYSILCFGFRNRWRIYREFLSYVYGRR
ncbi:MAG: gamma-glutamylcyclotransferase [Oscillospiraceae bacterium]|nr:gamma-glutamylcyclotransferase [Oscillospiraceae bacterium]